MKKTLLVSVLAIVVWAIQAQAAPTVITDQPEGELRTYTRSGVYAGYYFDSPSSQGGKLAQMVYATDGKTVYLKDPVCGYTKHSAWIKGEISADGQQISFPGGQYLWWDEEEEYGIQLAVIKNIKVDKYGDPDTYDIDTQSPIVYTVSGNTLAQQGTNEDSWLGVKYDDSEEWWIGWYVYGEHSTVLTLFDEQPVALPDGVQTTQYSVVYGGQQRTIVRIVNVGFDGSDVYIGGLSYYMPDAWVKGTVDGNTVTISGLQFAGVDQSAIYWMPTTAVWESYESWGETYWRYAYTKADQLELTIDPEHNTITATEALLLNVGSADISVYDPIVAPTLKPFTEKAIAPQDPTVYEDGSFKPAELQIDDDGDSYVRSGSFKFKQGFFDVEGNPLDYNKLTFQFYTGNDQPFTLTPEDYEDLDEDMTEMPSVYTMYDYYAYAYGSVSLYIYDPTIERIGVQAIYRGAGEELRSNIVYSDGTMSNYLSGIHKLTSDDGCVRAEYFDLQGRRIQTAKPGQLVIRRTVSADGTAKTTKVLK